MILPPLTFQKYVTAAISPSPYVMYLASATEASSFHVAMKCVTSSSTLLDKPSLLTVYEVNPSSVRSTADQMRRYVRGGADLIHGVTSSFGDYGKVRLTP